MRKLTGFEIAQIARESDTDVETIRGLEAQLMEQDQTPPNPADSEFFGRICNGPYDPELSRRTHALADAEIAAQPAFTIDDIRG